MPYRTPLKFDTAYTDKSGRPSEYFQRLLSDLMQEVASMRDAQDALLMSSTPTHVAVDGSQEAVRASVPAAAVQPQNGEKEALRLSIPLYPGAPPIDPRLFSRPSVPLQVFRWVIPDTFANQGNYPPGIFRDSAYLATDTNLWYYSTGSAWTQFGTFDDAYGGAWNGSTKAPTQNAIYDKFEPYLTAWTTWVPTFSSDIGNETATFSAITKRLFKYKLIGKSLHLAINFDGTLQAVTPAYIDLTLDTGLLPVTDDQGKACVIVNNTDETGAVYALSSGVLRIYRYQLAPFDSAASVAAFDLLTIEVS